MIFLKFLEQYYSPTIYSKAFSAGYFPFVFIPYGF